VTASQFCGRVTQLVEWYLAAVTAALPQGCQGPLAQCAATNCEAMCVVCGTTLIRK